MSDFVLTIVALVASALLGACVGFIAARRLPSRGRPVPGVHPEVHREVRPDAVEHSCAAKRPDAVRPPPPATLATSDIVEIELSDAEIDALPAELPFLAHARPRIASPPRTRVLNRL